MSDAPKRITADEARQAILDALIQAAQGYETQPFITRVYAYIDQTEAEVARLREALERIAAVMLRYSNGENGGPADRARRIARRALEDNQ